MISRFKIAVSLAFIVVVVHILAISAFWIYNGKEGLAVDMIMLPTLAVYATGAIKWIIANPRINHTVTHDSVGGHYVYMLVLVTSVFLGALLLGILGLFLGWDFVDKSVDVANLYFGFVEGGFGVLFGYFYDDLFGQREQRQSDTLQPPAPVTPPT